LRVTTIKYYQIISDENAELEMNVFSLAKGLLKKLNQGNVQLNIYAPFKAESVKSKENHCQVNAPTKYSTTPLVAYIVLPLWDKNDESITISLQLQPNGKKIDTLTCQLKKGDAYIVCCKNHTNQKNKMQR
jgi:hypothetical protein